MRKCLNCGKEYTDLTLDFCDCGGPIVDIDNEQKDEANDFMYEQLDLYDKLDDSQDTSHAQQEQERTDISTMATDNEDNDVLEQLNSIPEFDEEFESEIEEIETEKEIDSEFVPELVEESLEPLDEEVEEETIVFASVKVPGFSLKDVVEFNEDFNPFPDDFSIQDDNELQNTAQINGAKLQNMIEESGVQHETQDDALSSSTNVPIGNVNFGEQIKDSIDISIYKNKKVLIERTFSLDEIIIGRGLEKFETDISLKDFDQEKTTSRKHVKIVKYEGKYYLVNVSDKSPVRVNGKVIPKDLPIPLYDGDRIILGNKIGVLVRNS
ncbi:MAG: FHA domain-containing protein [Fervidobacterium sp.]|uniref:FHA domain-containing protein n=1 Tax=Fervidobacterium gondwanense DSM 13020 TaxID=1121883 RepID=A0A1M7TGA7_FERGO|nr:FHA domain-containing protein [Fervidobacterium gondwanense]UXF00261.1 hypothetical protein IB67_01305 [Fervidobacterium riparium]SHN69774.1 FHA domain-containing protein [Fervidobacterium gondwanense DSM 13020]